MDKKDPSLENFSIGDEISGEDGLSIKEKKGMLSGFFSKVKENREIDYDETVMFNLLKKEDQDEFVKQKLEKKKFQLGVTSIVGMVLVLIRGNLFLENQLKSAIAENEELSVQAQQLKTKIDAELSINDKLEEVSVNGRIVDILYNGDRKEILDALYSFESLTNKTTPLRVTKIERLSYLNYKITMEYVVKSEKLLNDHFVNVAGIVNVIGSSKTFAERLNSRNDGGKQLTGYFILEDFKGASYSETEGTIPLTLNLKFVYLSNKKENGGK